MVRGGKWLDQARERKHDASLLSWDERLMQDRLEELLPHVAIGFSEAEPRFVSKAEVREQGAVLRPLVLPVSLTHRPFPKWCSARRH